MNTFTDIVEQADRNLTANIMKRVDTQDDSSVPMCDFVMVRKVRKHLEEKNYRKIAAYIAMRLREFEAPLSVWAKDQLRTTLPNEYVRPGKGEILYLNPAGEWRAFNAKSAA